MSVPPLQLPTIQNWSCHNCSGCCRQHLIEITDEERQRILGQQWTTNDGVSDGPVVVPHRSSMWKKTWRLAHASDGSCIFLDGQGLCRIHAKFGEAAKPLACRIYPYAFHPSGKKVTVSLRFSCPSVVANLGKAVSENRDELKEIEQLVVPENAAAIPPPRISRREQLDWPDTLKIVHALEEVITDEDGGSVVERLFRALFVAGLVDQAQFALIRGARLGDLLEILSEAAAAEEIPDAEQPAGVIRMQFRLLVAHYARKDTVADLDAGFAGRWRLLRAATRFASGRGVATPLQDCFQEVPFESMEQSFGEFPAEFEKILTRYLRVKLQGLHFCGPAYYGIPLVEGFQSLALIVPAMCWIARWLAASDGRTIWTTEDLSKAMTIADHHHGYSPVFGSGGFRRRVNMLAKTEDLTRLLLWYAS
ncbi:MAG: YkgJ family cysteine cluster protein [Planctomycetota bacterium]|nr:YkgJ family cysteine cluster protein [Planctomycetota bacterium]